MPLLKEDAMNWPESPRAICPRCGGPVYVNEEEWVSQAICDSCGYLIGMVGPAGLPVGTGGRALGCAVGSLFLRLMGRRSRRHGRSGS